MYLIIYSDWLGTMIHIALLQYMIQKVHPDQCLLATVALVILMQSPSHEQNER